MQVTMGSIIHKYGQVLLGLKASRMVRCKTSTSILNSHWDSEAIPLEDHFYFQTFKITLMLRTSTWEITTVAGSSKPLSSSKGSEDAFEARMSMPPALPYITQHLICLSFTLPKNS